MKRPLDQDTESIQYCDIYVLEYLIEIEGLSSSQISEFIMTKNVNPNETIQIRGQEISIIHYAMNTKDHELVNFILNHKDFDPNQIIKFKENEYNFIDLALRTYLFRDDSNGEILNEEMRSIAINSIINHEKFDINNIFTIEGNEWSLITYAIVDQDITLVDAILNHKKFVPNQTVISNNQKYSLIDYIIRVFVNEGESLKSILTSDSAMSKIFNTVINHERLDPNQVLVISNNHKYSLIDYVIRVFMDEGGSLLGSVLTSDSAMSKILNTIINHERFDPNQILISNDKKYSFIDYIIRQFLGEGGLRESILTSGSAMSKILNTIINHEDFNPNQVVIYSEVETSLIVNLILYGTNTLVDFILNHKKFDPNQIIISNNQEHSLIDYVIRLFLTTGGSRESILTSDSIMSKILNTIINHEDFNPNQVVIDSQRETSLIVNLILYGTDTLENFILNHKKFDLNHIVPITKGDCSLMVLAVENNLKKLVQLILDNGVNSDQIIKYYGADYSLIAYAIEQEIGILVKFIFNQETFSHDKMIKAEGKDMLLSEFLVSLGEHEILSGLLKTESFKKNFNVNLRDISGDRLIDVVVRNLDQGINNSSDNFLMTLDLLRKYGSVEPKKNISSGISEKLIFKGGKSPDSDDSNIIKAHKLVQKLKTDVVLDEKDYQGTIAAFKQRHKDFMTIKAEWGGDITNVEEVINKISNMRDVKDRLVDTIDRVRTIENSAGEDLSDSWDFCEVLAKIIKLKEGDVGAEYKLIETLSSINMCLLSKLMYLLGCAQDELVPENSIDYAHKSFEDLQGYLSKVLNNIKSRLGEDSKSEMAVAKWLYDKLDQQNVKDPEDWNYLTRAVRGAFNKQMMNEPKYDGSSQYFTSGVEEILDRLSEEFTKTSDKVNPNLKEWEQVLTKGKIGFVIKWFDDIVNDPNKMDEIINNGYDNAELNFTDLSFVPRELLQEYVNKISKNHHQTVAKDFIELLRNHLCVNHKIADSLVIYSDEIKNQSQITSVEIISNSTMTSSVDDGETNTSSSQDNSNNDIELSGNVSSSPSSLTELL